MARLRPDRDRPAVPPVSRNGGRTLEARLSDKHLARPVKRTVAAAGLCPELAAAERLALYSCHSPRAGLASHTAADDTLAQRQLGHAFTEITRRYQRRRDRFRLNLTESAGLQA